MESILQANKGRYEAVAPLGASLLLHALLVGVLSTTSTFDFTVGNQTRFDILWLGAADLASPPVSESAATAASTSQQAVAAGEPVEEQGANPSSDETVAQVINHGGATPHAADAEMVALAIPKPAEILKAAKQKPAPVKPLETRVSPPAGSTVTAPMRQDEKKRETALPAQMDAASKLEAKTTGIVAASATAADERQKSQQAKKEEQNPIEERVAQKEQAPPKMELLEMVAAAPTRPVSTDPAPKKSVADPGAVTDPQVPKAATKLQPAPAAPVKQPEPLVKTAVAAPPAAQATKKVLPAAVALAAPPPKAQPASPLQPLKAAAPAMAKAAAPVATVAAPVAKVAAPVAKAAAPSATTPATAAVKPSPAGSLQVAASMPGATPQAASRTAAQFESAEKSAGKAAIAASKEAGKGMVLSSLNGDLKMVMAGDPAIRLTVSFRKFPKSRRSKTQSKSEAHNQKRVQPIFAKKGQAREAVIGSAGEGVYTFIAEPEHAAPVKGSFTLKLYESAAREKVFPVGTRTLSARTVIARVLMPEGILWEDDSAFSGSLEDSESVTKFNTQTGLYWKEYND